MIAFQPTGALATFTAATPTPPAAVQSINLSQVPGVQVMLTNTSTTIDVFVGWGTTAAQAAINAVAGANFNQYYLLRGTQVVVSAAPDAFFTGISASSTAVCYVQVGLGN